MSARQNEADGQSLTGEPVTPEMLEAGFRVLRNSGISDDYLEADKLLVAEIYRAMIAACPGSTSKPIPSC